MKPETGDVDDISRIHSTELRARVRTGAVLTVIGIFVLCFSHIHYVLNTVAAFLSILGIYELLRTVKANTFAGMLIFSLVSIIVCFFEIPHYPIILAIVWGIAVVVFLILMKRIGTYHFTSSVSIVPCALMLPLFFRSFVEIRSAEQGLYSGIGFFLNAICGNGGPAGGQQH